MGGEISCRSKVSIGTEFQIILNSQAIEYHDVFVPIEKTLAGDMHVLQRKESQQTTLSKLVRTVSQKQKILRALNSKELKGRQAKYRNLQLSITSMKDLKNDIYKSFQTESPPKQNGKSRLKPKFNTLTSG